MLQISQRPLQGTAVDAGLFVDRASALERLGRSVRLGFNSLLLGERGSGKTSLLRQFERQMVEASSHVRFVEASGASTVEELVELVRVAVHGRRRFPGEALLAPFATKTGIADDVARLVPADGEHAVVLLDSIASPEIVHHLFGRLRDEVWQLPITWVVSGNRSDRGRYLEAPADSFFDTVVNIDELDMDTATELLRRRGENAGSGDAAAVVLLGIAKTLAQRVTPRTPRNLLAAAREVLLANEDPTKWVTNHFYLQERANGLSRPAGMLFTELMDLGPVSPSDKRLLERLGWTRARAAQVFKQLEDEGLVVATDEASAGPGRPRRLYTPNSRFHAVEQTNGHP